MAESTLESLVYVSTAVISMSRNEIENLLSIARKRNNQRGITGVLMLNGGKFIQYLEGSPASIDSVKEIIWKDKRHTGILVLSRESIKERLFGEWAMAYQCKDDDEYSSSPHVREIIDASPETLDHNHVSAQLILHKFWHQNAV